jgi:fatty acid/phospholipid biosynthesis enzyme
LETSSSEVKLEKNRRNSICEFVDTDNEIKHYEQKLSKIHDEYKTSMICEWNAIREKEIYFR